MGRTHGGENWLEIVSRNASDVQVGDGAIHSNGQVWGGYLHGLFANKNLRHAWLKSLGWDDAGNQDTLPDPFAASLTYLSDTVESVLDMRKLEKMIWGN